MISKYFNIVINYFKFISNFTTFFIFKGKAITKFNTFYATK